MHRWILMVAALIAASLLAGCLAEEGERCDGFFSNGCRSPASCVETDDGAYCANSCSSGTCAPGFECRMVTINGAPMGGHCLPAGAGG